jgi:hypothetical protein
MVTEIPANLDIVLSFGCIQSDLHTELASINIPQVESQFGPVSSRLVAMVTAMRGSAVGVIRRNVAYYFCTLPLPAPPAAG